MPTAIKVSTKEKSRENYYRCSNCNAMFKPMIFFDNWYFFDCLPRVCPNCGKHFKNGMAEI